MSDNLLTNNEIKRRGLAVIEERLRHGPVRLMKRNKSAAVVLSEADYARLTASQGVQAPGLGAVQWLLAYAPEGGRSKRDIDAMLAAERDW